MQDVDLNKTNKFKTVTSEDDNPLKLYLQWVLYFLFYPFDICVSASGSILLS